jgi:hypothetical protein
MIQPHRLPPHFAPAIVHYFALQSEQCPDLRRPINVQVNQRMRQRVTATEVGQMSRPLEIQIIERARATISTQRWCRGFAALRSDGLETDPCAVSAARFCAVGALARAASDIAGWTAQRAEREAAKIADKLSPDEDLPSINDDPDRGRKVILALFDNALQKAIGQRPRPTSDAVQAEAVAGTTRVLQDA